MIAWAFRIFAIWGAGLLVIYALFGHKLLWRDPPSPYPVRVVPPDESAVREAKRAAPFNALTYRADKTGHVFLDAVVNGAAVRFLVDTGATSVSLTMRDAAAAGISRSSLNFSLRVNTANGTAAAAPIRLRELRLGQFSVTDLPAEVGENLPISLLGQTFLKRLSSYDMRDGVLTFYWN